MSWSLSMSGHFPGDNAEAVESAKASERALMEDIRAVFNKHGASSFVLYTQYYGVVSSMGEPGSQEAKANTDLGTGSPVKQSDTFDEQVKAAVAEASEPANEVPQMIAERNLQAGIEDVAANLEQGTTEDAGVESAPSVADESGAGNVVVDDGGIKYEGDDK